MSDLHALSAAELADSYRTGQLSPVAVTQAVLEHIHRWEPHLCASYLLRPEHALVQARASEARWREGKALGPLDGVPVTIKENIATQGDPVPLGTAATQLVPAPADAPPAARLREAGAVLVCKTTMPDYGMLSSGLSSFHPLSRNPWDLSKTPGGSSAGGAAAAAAGYGPLHVGTDIGGSLRLPAGWCGIFRASFDQGTDRLRGLKIGLLLDAGCGLPAEPEVLAAVQAAARRFEAAGAIVEPMRPFMTQTMLDGMDHFWRTRSRLDMNALMPADKARVLPYIRAWADSATGMDGEAVFRAASQFHAVRVASVKACAAFDYVISPTAPMPAFPAELPSPTNDPLHPLEHIGFTVPYNMSEQPAASINCGYTSAGLPIGLQIAGQRFDDLGVLQVARAFELIRDVQRPWPQPPGP